MFDPPVSAALSFPATSAIIEGAFNWLSAARDEASAYQRLEASFSYTGRDAGRFVGKAVERLEAARMPRAA